MFLQLANGNFDHLVFSGLGCGVWSVLGVIKRTQAVSENAGKKDLCPGHDVCSEK